MAETGLPNPKVEVNTNVYRSATYDAGQVRIAKIARSAVSSRRDNRNLIKLLEAGKKIREW